MENLQLLRIFTDRSIFSLNLSRILQLLRMTEEWRPMRDDGPLVGIVSMDLFKAFDVIQHPLLLA